MRPTRLDPRTSPRARTLAIGIAIALPVSLASVVPALAGYASFARPDGGGGIPTHANGQASTPPSVKAYRLSGGETIQIDGALDDAAWARAETGGGFRTWDPDRGQPEKERTAFKVAYDEHAVYFAIACYEHDPNQIASTLSRRDRFSNSDYVSVHIDPYHDKTTGFSFRVNPRGVQQDAYYYNDGDTDFDWDAVWEARTTRDRDGWYAEIRIPLASIRYRTTVDAWGLQVQRFMQSRGESTAWTVWDRDVPGYVSQFGTVTGIRDIPNPRQLEVMPYTVLRSTDYAAPGSDEMDDFENLGLDMKYGVTSDLTLNATFQPDFGQVEADPATLNLSPFETFYSEKRPFFIEGSRYFEHPDFNLFYSRRIGTGSESARIRYAGKLTGKTAGDVSLAALFASTDVTQKGQAHNFIKGGEQQSNYFVGRMAKEFDSGRHRVGLTQTAVANSASREDVGDFGSREAYTTGVDFMSHFSGRTYRLEGSFVGSVIDPEKLASAEDAPSKRYGTGGEIGLRRRGNLSAGTWFRWESDRLDLNDMGFLSAPDEMNSGAWVSYGINPDGESSWLNRGNLNVNLYKSWIYGDRTGYDIRTGEQTWRYSKGHRGFASGNVNGWMQFTNYMEAWWGFDAIAEGTQRYETRSWVERSDGSFESIPGGGPLMTEPTTYGFWAGYNTDTRKDLEASIEISDYWDVASNYSARIGLGVGWTQSAAMNHEAHVSYRKRIDDTQHVGNFESTDGGGIGGVDHVFGKIDQRTVDLTLRTNLLFTRNQSLELYAQPFITVGDYTQPRRLAQADTYDLEAYEADGFDVADNDFSFSAVNVNAVYRWEYRPGSTLFLVWAHSRSSYDQAAFHDGSPGAFDNALTGDALFSNEPENTFLVKLTYWLPI